MTRLSKYPDLSTYVFQRSPTLADVYCWMRPGQSVVTRTNPDGSFASCEYEFQQDDPPTQEEIEYCKKQLFDHYEKTKHHWPRQLSYPSIGDQLDALYHAGVFPPEMEAKIRAVKESFPKSESSE